MKKKKYNVLSLFDGMSCGMIALERAGIEVTSYYASEIDKYASIVSDKNYPEIKRLGCITKHDDWDLPEIDLLIAGFPCQAWSLAGKQKGDNDPRGALVHDLIEIWKKYKPKYFMFENVKMKKEFLEYINELFGVEPILINSALVSAQNRNRYYWTNIPNIERPADKGITWGDIRESGVNAESFYYSGKAMQWLGRNSQKRKKTLTVHKDDEKMQMIEASHYKKYSQQRFFGIIDQPDDRQAIAAMRGRYLLNGVKQDAKIKTAGKTKQYIEFRYDGKSNALTTVTKDNIVVPFTLPDRVAADDFLLRYITPLECERLQTIPDNYTNHVSNTQRYKMIGNGWTVDVIAHIFKAMKRDQRMKRRQKKKYNIIYADPPWDFNNKNTGGSMKSGASAKYHTLKAGHISEFDINSIAADDCILFMWWVGSQPEEALAVVKAWGFTVKTMTGFVWEKRTKNDLPFFGMGFWTRAGSECCLIATKGKVIDESDCCLIATRGHPKPLSHSIRSVIKAKVGKHSAKPHIFRRRIVQLCGKLPRVELFARKKFTGWDSLGFDIDGKGLKESIMEITNADKKNKVQK